MDFISVLSDSVLDPMWFMDSLDMQSVPWHAYTTVHSRKVDWDNLTIMVIAQGIAFSKNGHVPKTGN